MRGRQKQRVDGELLENFYTKERLLLFLGFQHQCWHCILVLLLLLRWTKKKKKNITNSVISGLGEFCLIWHPPCQHPSSTSDVHSPCMHHYLFSGLRQRGAATRLKRVMSQRQVAENVIVAPICSDLLLHIYQGPSSMTLEFPSEGLHSFTQPRCICYGWTFWNSPMGVHACVCVCVCTLGHSRFVYCGNHTNRCQR